jgi:hypothetical protein
MATATSPLLSLSSLSASLPSPVRAPASLSLRALAPQARLSTSYAAFPIGTAPLFSRSSFLKKVSVYSSLTGNALVRWVRDLGVYGEVEEEGA